MINHNMIIGILAAHKAFALSRHYVNTPDYREDADAATEGNRDAAIPPKEDANAEPPDSSTMMRIDTNGISHQGGVHHAE